MKTTTQQIAKSIIDSGHCDMESIVDMFHDVAFSLYMELENTEIKNTHPRIACQMKKQHAVFADIVEQLEGQKNT